MVPSTDRASAAMAYGGSPAESVICSRGSWARATAAHSGVRKMLLGDRWSASAPQAVETSDGTRAVQPASGLVERVTCAPSLGARQMNALSPTYHSRVPERAAPRVLIAPQSFKGSADAVAVAAAIARGVRAVWPRAEIVEMPLADGGEGTVHALVTATRGEIRRTRVHDPLLREIDAEWGMLGDHTTAVVEMAAANGLPLLREHERDPRITSTRGTGELILAAAMS